MIRLNPDPQTGGYAYMPIRSLTSRFPAHVDAQEAVHALIQAGVSDEQIDIFSGKLGADQLDTEGRLHGLWVRFVRALEDMFTDEAPLFHRADDTMRSGGSVVTVFTAGRPEERKRASEILKSHGGLDTVYWGGWVTEYM
jgi:hypothetical protein